MSIRLWVGQKRGLLDGQIAMNFGVELHAKIGLKQGAARHTKKTSECFFSNGLMTLFSLTKRFIFGDVLYKD